MFHSRKKIKARQMLNFSIRRAYGLLQNVVRSPSCHHLSMGQVQMRN